MSSISQLRRRRKRVGRHEFLMPEAVQNFIDRLLLRHIFARNSPRFNVFKFGLAAGLALVFTNLLQNPDRVSTAFNAYLCVSPILLIGLQQGLDIIRASLVGSIAATLCNIVIHPTVIGEYSEETAEWLVAIYVPVAVMISSYVLYFMGFADPGSHSSAAFSALFVVLVPFQWPLFGFDWEGLPSVFATLLVRIGAILIGAVAAMLVNLMVSSPFVHNIVKRRMKRTERSVFKVVDIYKSATDPKNCFPQIDATFTNIVQLMGELEIVKKELAFRRYLLCAPCFGDWTHTLKEHKLRQWDQQVQILYRVLTLQNLLLLNLDTPTLTSEEKACLSALIKMTDLRSEEGAITQEIIYLRSSGIYRRLQRDSQAAALLGTPSMRGLVKMTLHLLSQLAAAYEHVVVPAYASSIFAEDEEDGGKAEGEREGDHEKEMKSNKRGESDGNKGKEKEGEQQQENDTSLENVKATQRIASVDDFQQQPTSSAAIEDAPSSSSSSISSTTATSTTATTSVNSEKLQQRLSRKK
ncbi:hypothetical protein QOT17_017964 [Balamuthia mandrillaris]